MEVKLDGPHRQRVRRRWPKVQVAASAEMVATKRVRNYPDDVQTGNLQGYSAILYAKGRTEGPPSEVANIEAGSGKDVVKTGSGWVTVQPVSGSPASRRGCIARRRTIG